MNYLLDSPLSHLEKANNVEIQLWIELLTWSCLSQDQTYVKEQRGVSSLVKIQFSLRVKVQQKVLVILHHSSKAFKINPISSVKGRC